MSADDHLTSLSAQVLAVLRSQPGMDEQTAMRLASQIVDATRRQFSGERVYFSAPRYDARAVLADFNGANRDEVCRKHRISKNTLYRLLQRRR